MMRLKPADIDHIIELIEQIAKEAQKTDFLPAEKKKLLDAYRDYEWCTNEIEQVERLDKQNETVAKVLKLTKERLKQIKIPYDGNKARRLKRKLGDEKIKHRESVIEPLQEKLDLYLAPLWPTLNKLSFQPNNLQKWIWRTFLSGDIMSLENNIVYDNKEMMVVEFAEIHRIKDKTERELKRIKAKLEYQLREIQEPPETEHDTTPAKRRRIWICVKKIPRWIYYLVGFLAALLTSIYLLWWLWTKFSP